MAPIAPGGYGGTLTLADGDATDVCSDLNVTWTDGGIGGPVTAFTYGAGATITAITDDALGAGTTFKTYNTNWRIKYAGTGDLQSDWIPCTTTGMSGYSSYYKTYSSASTCYLGQWTWDNYSGEIKPRTPETRLREIMRTRMAPVIIVRTPAGLAQDQREEAARQTLRRVIGDRKYRRFLSHGHITVRGQSGLVYQIFPGHGITRVYKDGVQTERLCVVMKGDFPPTDSLIMRFLLILNDEADFRSHAITHQVLHPKVAAAPDSRNLAEVFKQLKLVA